MSFATPNLTACGKSSVELDELSVLTPSPHLHNRYDAIFIVDSHRQALEIPINKNHLIVTSDWLSWRKLTDLGVHCLHFEAMLGRWTKPRGSQENLVMDANAWHFDGSEDISLFLGVSLGNGFGRHMTYMYNAYNRLRVSLNSIIKTYRPKTIIYYGIKMESDILDFPIIKIILKDVSKTNSCTLIVEGDRTATEEPTYPVGRFLDTQTTSVFAIDRPIRLLLRQVYLVLIKTLFTLRFSLGRRKPRVYLFLNWLGVQKLVDAFDLKGWTPVLLVEPWPKSFAFLVRCLYKGVYLTTLPMTKLSLAEIKDVEVLISNVESSWSDQTTPFQLAQSHFIRQYFLNNQRIFDRALEVKRYNILLQKMKISRTVVGDSENSVCSTVIETARTNNIPSDELLNGMFLSSQQTPNRNVRDKGNILPLDRLLSWGEVNDNWLNSTTSPLQSVRTGYPAISTDGLATPLRPAQRNNALLLPIIPSGDDPAALYSQTFWHLVSTARVLKACGYKSLRVKIHPGHVSTKAYFEKILSYYKIDCQVISEGPLSVQIDWADLVVGPVNSGSHVEVLAQGKPYYPCQIFPSSLNQNLFKEVISFATIEELKNALSNEYLPDRQSILEYFCSSQSIPNAAHRFWQVIADTEATMY